MYKLTNEQKEDLKSLQGRPGYKVLLEVYEDFELSILRKLKRVDTSNADHLAILKKNMDYLKGMEDLIATLKSATNKVAERK